MKKIIVLLLLPFLGFTQNDTIKDVKSKLSVIGLDRMNVVYRGVPNPISIAVNNAKSYKISGNGVSQNEEGKYVLRPGPGTETKVFVEIEKLDGSKVVEEHIFRIKVLPAPIGTLNNEYSFERTLYFKKEELINAVVNYKIIDFLIDFNPSVTKFKISLNENKVVEVEGNKFNKEVLSLIKSATKKDYFKIFSIRTNYMHDDGISAVEHRYPHPIVFKIIE